MGLGIDLEAAAAEPYHAMKANPHHHAASAGGRRRGCCSAACSASEENEGCFTLVLATLTTTVMLLAVFAVTAIFALMYRELSFSIDLAGYDGIDPGRAARVVSPSFSVTLRVNNTCVDSADVAVLYSGVALGRVRVEPRDCAEVRWARDVEAVARGRGLGVSRRLRDRMGSDWRSGAVELDVDVKIYDDGRRIDTEIPRNMFVGKVRMMDQTART